MITMTVYKCDHEGREMLHYSGTLVDRGPTWVCLQAPFSGTERKDLGVVAFAPGDLFTEWHYNDRYYNVFKVQDGDGGSIKGWYCNITRPATITADSVAADDLALDVFVSPDGETTLLDEDEFEALDLSSEDRAAARAAVEAIHRRVAACEEPFDALAR